MKNTLTYLKLSGALLLSAVFSATLAKASFINGDIQFSATAASTLLPKGAELNTATGFKTITGVKTLAPDSTAGAYLGIAAGTPVTFSPFNFDALSVSPLWSFKYLGLTYSFYATSVVIDFQTPASPKPKIGSELFLNLSGVGYATITGSKSPFYDPTPGTWTITDTAQYKPGNSKATFSATFSATSQSFAAPDGGSTALLITLGLAGLGTAVLARRLRAVKA